MDHLFQTYVEVEYGSYEIFMALTVSLADGVIPHSEILMPIHPALAPGAQVLQASQVHASHIVQLSAKQVATAPIVSFTLPPVFREDLASPCVAGD